MQTIVTLDKNDPKIGTCGGEQWIADVHMDDYGLQIGDFLLDGMESGTVKQIVKQLTDHLIINGHRVEIRKTQDGEKLFFL